VRSIDVMAELTVACVARQLKNTRQSQAMPSKPAVAKEVLPVVLLALLCQRAFGDHSRKTPTGSLNRPTKHGRFRIEATWGANDGETPLGDRTAQREMA
jgi:hypothetical protein